MSHFLIAIAFVLASPIHSGPHVAPGLPGECLLIPETGTGPVGDLLPHMSDVAGPRALIASRDGGAIAVGSMWDSRQTDSPSGLEGFAYWAQKLNAYGEPEWTRTYPAESDMEALAVAEGANGGFLIVGREAAINYDLALVKIDPHGDVEWRNTYELGSDTQPSSVMATPDGGFIITGTITERRRSRDRALILKVNPFGSVMWTHAIAPWSDSDVAPYALAADIGTSPNGEYVVIGASYIDHRRESWLTLINAAGEIGSISIVSDIGDTYLDSVSEVGDGYAVVGTIVVDGYAQILFARVNRDGTVTSTSIISEPNNMAASGLVPLSNGGFLITGMRFDGESTSALLLRVDESGDQLWCRIFTSLDRWGFGKAVAETSERYIVWAGLSARKGISNDYGWKIVVDHDGTPVE